MRILTVDDEPSVRAALRRALVFDGHDVTEAEDGERALRLLAGPAADGIDLVVLDVAMPGLDGLEVCRRIRTVDGRLPILLLTARGSTADRVAGLDAGADDYVVKPFDLDELLARVRALLRRSRTTAEADGAETVSVLRFDDVELDVGAHRCRRAGVELRLTRTEFALLEMFLRQPKLVHTRDMIFESVWGYDFGGSSNTHEVHISSLRRKLEAGGARRIIQTVRGVGFRLSADGSDG